MPRHPLDIPEILAHVGSFIPTWTDLYSLTHSGTFSLKPTTLCICLRVSKLWYRTLLPILWHSFWADHYLCYVPAEAIRCHSHLFKILRTAPTLRQQDFALFNCTKLDQLIAFDIEYIFGAGAEAQDGQHGDAADPWSHGKRLLRSNPCLKSLHWEAAGGVMRPLDVEDFLGFKQLESLSLKGWDCSGGQLGQVLRLLAGTLKKLSVYWSNGMRPEELSPLAQQRHSQQETRLDNTVDDELVLEHLQSIKLGRTPKPMDQYLTELVKHSPNLTCLELLLEDNRLDATRLAHNFRIHSPNLTVLILSSVLPTYQVETLLQHSSATGFHKLGITVRDSNDALVSATLQHASTLERLQLSVGDDNMDKEGYLRLLVKCARMTHFTLSRVSSLRISILEQLMQQTWGCRASLQELDLCVGICGASRQQLQQGLQEQQQHQQDPGAEKNVIDIPASMGWEHVNPCYRKQDPVQLQADRTRLRLALELVLWQKLDNLRVLRLDYVDFRPSPTRNL